MIFDLNLIIINMNIDKEINIRNILSMTGKNNTFMFVYLSYLLFMMSLFVTNNLTKYSLREILMALTYFMMFHWGVYVQSNFIEQPCECGCDCDCG